MAILTLGFGLVGIDRFLISTLFPTIASDLKLSYGDIGTALQVAASNRAVDAAPGSSQHTAAGGFSACE